MVDALRIKKRLQQLEPLILQINANWWHPGKVDTVSGLIGKIMSVVNNSSFPQVTGAFVAVEMNVGRLLNNYRSICTNKRKEKEWREQVVLWLNSFVSDVKTFLDAIESRRT